MTSDIHYQKQNVFTLLMILLSHFASKNIKNIETVMNCELKLASQWMKLNKLSLNR